MRSVALRVVQIGAVVAVLIVLPSRAYDLDRFLAPKEVVLHVTAVLAALIVLVTRAGGLSPPLDGLKPLSTLSFWF